VRSILFFLLLSFKLYSQVQGKAQLDRYFFKPGRPEKGLKVGTCIWYVGKESIQEVPQLDTRTDSTGTYTNTSIKYYLFINPGLRQYCYYKNFSDTSRLIMHFKSADSVIKYGGWDLYSDKKFEYDSYRKLGDTVVDGEQYGRYRFHKIKNGKKNDFVLYTSCEKKDVPVRYLKPFVKVVDCPVIRMDTYYENQLVSIAQLTYLSDVLTEKEIKVFNAWEQNAKKNPVTK
jgi:hypothetical protein